MTLEEYARKKREAEEAQREADRAAGQYEELLRQHKKDFGHKTIKESEISLKELRKEEAMLSQQIEKAEAGFLQEFGERIGK